MYENMEAYIHAFLTPVLGEGKWEDSGLGRFTSLSQESKLARKTVWTMWRNKIAFALAENRSNSSFVHLEG